MMEGPWGGGEDIAFHRRNLFELAQDTAVQIGRIGKVVIPAV
jgi:hypothetical protein